MSNLKKFREHKKLKHLTDSFNAIIKQFEENSNALDKINELQKKLQEKVSKSLAEIENTNKQNKTELTILFEEKTDQIRKENKDFYKEFESTVKIKLDDNKSEIKRLIEIERNQIKQIIEIEFAKNTKELRQVIDAENKTIKISIWVIGGLILILTSLAVLKLWMV
ncbi:hypothetical protein V8V91_26260 [Algoriphagus halophilus]|uniref:hypothetical protein n=1 Tax=Algoriphagus halophilus TaxID=226505 RepID=UPI00358FC9B5